MLYISHVLGFAAVTVTLRDTDRVPLGATPTFICIASDSGQSTPKVMKWTKGPSQPLPNDPKRYRPSRDKKYLSILSVKKSEEGWYYCHCQTTSGQDISGKAELYVIGDKHFGNTFCAFVSRANAVYFRFLLYSSSQCDPSR